MEEGLIEDVLKQEEEGDLTSDERMELGQSKPLYNSGHCLLKCPTSLQQLHLKGMLR